MRLSVEGRRLVAGCGALDELADADGIVCLPAVRSETSAAEQLAALLRAAFGATWSTGKEAELLTAAGSSGLSLDEWLRTAFFEQHCKLFHHRPFIWHVWVQVR